MHRPETKIQTQSIHMATLLLKVFPNIKAVAHHGHNALPAQPVQIKELQNFVKRNLSTLSKTFAENMPDWVTAKYFDPEAERHRLLTHDYQQSDIYHTRYMENTKLVDSIHLPLKCRNDVVTALKKMLAIGLEVYLSEFIAPFIGDWPMQFFILQLVYSNTANIPATIKNVIPFIGPLHISLNARECVVLNFQDVFSDLYTFLFGNKDKLAKKPRPWRISFLLEVIYGGWTLVRDAILSAFGKSKDIEFLTLLNLIDNYVPLVLRGQPTLYMFLAKLYRVTSYILLWFTLYTTYHISF